MHVKHKGDRRAVHKSPAAIAREEKRAAAAKAARDTEVRSELIGLGFYLYPGPENTKHGFKGWNRYASNQPEILCTFGKRDITVAHTGFSDFVALDLDHRGNAKNGVTTFLRVSRENNLRWPKTRVHGSTANGGRHIIYRQNPDCIVPTFIGLFPGVDLKGAGNHQVVVPPTPGRIVIEDSPIAVMPAENAQFLVEAMESRVNERASNLSSATTPGGDSAYSLGGVLQALSLAEEGHRNTMLYWAACRVLQDMPASKQRMAMWNVRATAADIGLSDQEIDHVIASARRGGHRG